MLALPELTAPSASAARPSGAAARPAHLHQHATTTTTTTAPSSTSPPATTPTTPLPASMPADPFATGVQAGQNPSAPKTSARPAVKGPHLKKAATLPPGAAIVFDNARQQVELVVPGPETWTLFVNEPDAPGTPTVGTATGSSGTLVVPYPQGFCGVIQADVLVGPKSRGPGERSSIDTGGCPQIPTSPGGTSGGGGGGSPPGGGAPGTVTSASGAPGTATASEPTLPFTGVGRGLQGSAITGTAALLVGLFLLLLSSPRHPRLALARRRAIGTFLWLLGD